MTITSSGVLIVPLIIACIMIFIGLLFAVPAYVRIWRAAGVRKAQEAARLRNRNQYQDAFRSLIDASDSMVMELESNKATTATLNEGVVDAFYTARQNAWRAYSNERNRLES